MLVEIDALRQSGNRDHDGVLGGLRRQRHRQARNQSRHGSPRTHGSERESPAHHLFLPIIFNLGLS
jgi:hypothetical protein